MFYQGCLKRYVKAFWIRVLCKKYLYRFLGYWQRLKVLSLWYTAVAAELNDAVGTLFIEILLLVTKSENLEASWPQQGFILSPNEHCRLYQYLQQTCGKLKIWLILSIGILGPAIVELISITCRKCHLMAVTWHLQLKTLVFYISHFCHPSFK